VGLRIVGFAPKVPIAALGRFYPVMWLGFAVNLVSGALLLIGYPTKALTNPVFYAKLLCIACGMTLMLWLRGAVVRVDRRPTRKVRTLAALSLFAWTGAIVAGRLLAYTCTWLLRGSPC
jgi:hypothetical protein